ncbi:hypothetical protein WICMUC_000279 [Wickerhamomyces mucosus]|uniref:MHF histone-fold complex subunit 1 n=1 Tax=Wickerhamomyces mucosus TaxID=1378264 RepID=A0A9P8TIX1_9ASCO|nr:hypothetical protein WICMUC_000279 [Wickerhamomyces mucosus]
MSDIPITTISRLFQTVVFTEEDTRITQQTLELSSEYLKMFVREAILRANEARINQNKNEGRNLGEKLIDDVLDTEHLSEIAGLLVLDF